MGKRGLLACRCLSSWCLVIVIVLWLFLTVPWVGVRCVIVVLPDHTHLGDNCIRNFQLGKYIPNGNFEYGQPHSDYLLCFKFLSDPRFC